MFVLVLVLEWVVVVVWGHGREGHGRGKQQPRGCALWALRGQAVRLEWVGWMEWMVVLVVVLAPVVVLVLI